MYRAIKVFVIFLAFFSISTAKDEKMILSLEKMRGIESIIFDETGNEAGSFYFQKANITYPRKIAIFQCRAFPVLELENVKISIYKSDLSILRPAITIPIKMNGFSINIFREGKLFLSITSRQAKCKDLNTIRFSSDSVVTIADEKFFIESLALNYEKSEIKIITQEKKTKTIKLREYKKEKKY